MFWKHIIHLHKEQMRKSEIVCILASSNQAQLFPAQLNFLDMQPMHTKKDTVGYLPNPNSATISLPYQVSNLVSQDIRTFDTASECVR